MTGDNQNDRSVVKQDETLFYDEETQYLLHYNESMIYRPLHQVKLYRAKKIQKNRRDNVWRNNVSPSLLHLLVNPVFKRFKR